MERDSLRLLVERLKSTPTVLKKLDILNALPEVQKALPSYPLLTTFLEGLNPSSDFALKAVLALEQGPLVFQGLDTVLHPFEALRELIKTLIEVEQLYQPLGGIVGYHLTALELIKDSPAQDEKKNIHYLHPLGTEMSSLNKEVRQAIRWGIEDLGQMGEIYPVGGAGDRLNLIDEENRQPLPAAELQFEGRSLLEGLIRDLQGREYLHFRLTGEHITTPLALMTSHEKENHAHILDICEKCNWFDRPRESFFFFNQPLVPVITKHGDWSLSAPLKLNLKPGGHGVLWKLAVEQGAFHHFNKAGRKKVLVRQINNPIAGTDYGLLAFTGLGCHGDKIFGFASCERLLKTPEGMNVLVEEPKGDGIDYTLTNVEYTEFAKKGLQDAPCKEEKQYSMYPSNTNILFADLDAIEAAVKKNPFPGLLLNMKTPMPTLTREGNVLCVEAGRLETTMQNIADCWPVHFDTPPSKEALANLPTFITFNQRRKTISVTKTSYVPGKSIQGTPEGCYFDLLQNTAELLTHHCKMQIPPLGTEQTYLSEGPSFLFSYHPALGPLYEVIAQKVHGGTLHPGGELQLELAEVEIENLHVQGSLLIQGDLMDSRCILKNVTIENQGIDRTNAAPYWKRAFTRIESVEITLETNSEFYAENVHIKGNQRFHVPAGIRLTVSEKEGELHLEQTPAGKDPLWNYHFAEDQKIVLTKKSPHERALQFI